MSLIRDNLMTQPGYSPYCGNPDRCSYGMPRTRFIKGQFQCPCGWRSGFDAEFIAQYQAKWAGDALPAPSHSRTEPASPLNQENGNA